MSISTYESIDTRSLRSEAISMLKSGQAVSKTVKRAMKTKLHSQYDPFESIGESSYSSMYNDGVKNKQVKDIGFHPSDTGGSFQFAENVSITSQTSAYDKKSWYAFKMYSKYSSNAPRDDDQLAMPFDSIEEAMQLLSEIYHLKPVRKSFKKEFFRGRNQIDYQQFKTYVDLMFGTGVSSGGNGNRNAHSPPRSPFMFPITRSQPLLATSAASADSISFTQNGFSNSHVPTTAEGTVSRGFSHSFSAVGMEGTTEVSPSIVTLHGKIVPVNYVKTAIVDVFKKENNDQRKISPKRKTGTQFLLLFLQVSFLSMLSLRGVLLLLQLLVLLKGKQKLINRRLNLFYMLWLLHRNLYLWETMATA
jgi:hypothetical protein